MVFNLNPIQKKQKSSSLISIKSKAVDWKWAYQYQNLRDNIKQLTTNYCHSRHSSFSKILTPVYLMHQ